ncbi:MAG: hypothetical protein M3M88_01405 [Thermoproteota archaeon]|nr:hypothetical protein [Thermoproteota archaeon]
MDFNRLDDGKPIDVGGKTIPTKNIPNCGIGFILSNNQSGIIEYFNQIVLQYPNIINVKDEQSFSEMPSILGGDFLSRYHMIIQDRYMILEK